MVTSGADKVVKVWDVAGNTPTCLHSEEAKLVCTLFFSGLIVMPAFRGGKAGTGHSYTLFISGLVFIYDAAHALKSASALLVLY